jgi:hypothetical protein
MMASGPVVVISTLAEYQTRFWAPVGVELRRHGFDVAYLCFDDPSFDELRRQGFEAHDMFSLSGPALGDDTESDRVIERYGVTRLNLWLSHERLAFGVRDTRTLSRRLAAYLRAAERAFERVAAAARAPVLVQELGGFLSVIAAYHVARARGIDNWFIEPAFFRGRLFFTRNSFAAPAVADDEQPVRRVAAMEAYLAQTLASGAIVIPKKDRHHYRRAASKVLDTRNVRRLVRKVVDKYALGRRREFDHIWQYASAHLQMAVNSWRLRRAYTCLDAAGPFVYFPFHVPGDVALTLRSPEYLDQLGLVEFLARTVPESLRVVVKEHPAQVGAVEVRRLRGLLRRYDNVVVLPPETNNFEVLRRAKAVVSVNSKSGAEALLVGTPVIVLGDAFYRPYRGLSPVSRLAELPEVLRRVTARPPEHDPGLLRDYIQRVWDRTRPGELYVPAPENVKVFTESLVAALRPEAP